MSRLEYFTPLMFLVLPSPVQPCKNHRSMGDDQLKNHSLYVFHLHCSQSFGLLVEAVPRAVPSHTDDHSNCEL